MAAVLSSFSVAVTAAGAVAELVAQLKAGARAARARPAKTPAWEWE